MRRIYLLLSTAQCPINTPFVDDAGSVSGT
jgi:hypothetical protein